MRVSILARNCAFAALLLSPALAMADSHHSADAGSFKDMPELPPVLWTGAYVGVHMGHAWGDSSTIDYGEPVADGAFACEPALVSYCGLPFDYTADGWVSGIQLGYNWRRDWLLFGIEADFGRIDADNTRIRDRTVDQDLVGVDYGWYSALTARLGIAYDRALIYVKGGPAFAEIDNLATDLDEAPFAGSGIWAYDPLSTVSDHGIEAGWAFGGGIEYALSESVSIKAEYLYMDFGERVLTDIDGDRYKLSNDMQTAKLGINYRFGARHAAEPEWYGKGADEAPPIVWTGKYLGVHAAVARGHSTSVDYNTIPGTPGSDGGFACDPAGYCGEPFNYDGTGWITGLQAGYNWQRHRLVFGIEGDLGRIDLDRSECKERTATDADIASVEYGWYGALTGRVGLPLHRALLYVKGGLAVAEITNEAADIDKIGEIFFIDPLSETRSKRNATGWTVGGGIEYALHGDWRLKAEYLYMDFGSETSSDPDGDRYKHDNELHVVKLGVNYYVNRAEPELPPLK